MEFARLAISPYGGYLCKNTSNIAMTILGRFLVSDVIRPLFFKEWAFDNESDHACANLTDLDKENGYIVLSDLYSEEETPTELKMTPQQFVQILTDWEEKVCKLLPKEVIIKHENDQFVFETKE